jgi:hypothetical protein
MMKHGTINSIKNKNKQSLQWKHPGAPPPKKFKSVPLARKMMASIVWDSQGIIMFDYLEQGRTINGTYYADELRRLCQKRAKKEKKTDSRRFAPAGQCTSSHILSYDGC